MLKSTRNLLLDTHSFLESIGYDFNKNSINDQELIEEKVIYHINRSKDIGDLYYLYENLNKYYLKDKKIKKKVNKHKDFWNSIESSTDELETISSEEAVGKYYLSNVYFQEFKEVGIQSETLEELSVYKYQNSKNMICSDLFDNPYYLKFTNKSTRAIILNKNKSKCGIIEIKNCDLVLHNNDTEYDIIQLEDLTYGIFKKDYLDKHKNDYDLDECYGCFYSCIVDYHKYLGFAQLELYKDCDDVDLFMVFAFSKFVLQANEINAIQAGTRAGFIAAYSLNLNRRIK